MATAPIHHEGKPLDDAAAAALVVKVRASAVRATSASLDELATAVPEPVLSMSLRAWPLDFPDDIAVQRRAPYEARADSVMYRQVLAEQTRARGWDVHLYDAKDIESQAASVLGVRADEVLPAVSVGLPDGSCDRTSSGWPAWRNSASRSITARARSGSNSTTRFWRTNSALRSAGSPA